MFDFIKKSLFHSFKSNTANFSAVALSRGGATKLLKKVWEAFIVRSDRIGLREQQTSLQTKKIFGNQLKAAQQVCWSTDRCEVRC